VFSGFLLNSSEKTGGANHKLIVFPLQHNRGFSGGQGRPAPKDVGFASPCDLLPEIEPIESEMIFLWLDFFHLNSVSYHIHDKTLNHDKRARAGSILDAGTELTP
jgi:hypothetical protein